MTKAAVKTSIKRIAIHHFWRSRRSRILRLVAMSLVLMVFPVWQRNPRQRFKCASASCFFQASSALGLRTFRPHHEHTWVGGHDRGLGYGTWAFQTLTFRPHRSRAGLDPGRFHSPSDIWTVPEARPHPGRRRKRLHAGRRTIYSFDTPSRPSIGCLDNLN